MTILKPLLSIAIGLSFAAFLTAGKEVNPQGKGNEAKGRYYFRQTCKECHTKGAKGGEVTPLTKTMAQWRTYFTKGKHAGTADALGKLLTEDQLRDVETFLVNHAADSAQPETCGK
jgi:mono/diheme cytochrome c family protein